MAASIVNKEQWLTQRLALLEQEKEFLKLKDKLSQQRAALPWVKVDSDYQFDTEHGSKSLEQLFGNCSQLLVYHFMYHPNWQEGCKSCSFWADNYNGTQAHLAQRDVQLIAISRAPLAQLLQYKQRMGWSFDWVSCGNNRFNYDYQVSFDQGSEHYYYNYQDRTGSVTELPGISVFNKNADGEIFHSYSCYARGLDLLNSSYQMLDLTPKGRDEEQLDYPMAWLKRHDEY